MKKPSRRQFLVAGGLVGGGVILGFATLAPSRQAEAATAVAGPDDRLFATWIKISPDNIVTIYVPHSEMGQGVHTSMAMMAAEELDADWNLVRVEQAPAQMAFANDGLARAFLLGGRAVPAALTGIADLALLKAAQARALQITGGSTAVRFTGRYGMAFAGAGARDMLVRAAAARWAAPVAECVTAMGRVSHPPSGRSASYGELAAEASELPPPAKPQMKAPERYLIVGTSVPRVDIPAKVDGSAPFGIDAAPPGLLYAAVLHSPVFGGELLGHDAATALRRRGVRKIVVLPGAIAVVADSYWRAKEALPDLDARFGDAGQAGVSSASLHRAQTEALAGLKAEKDIELGDAAAYLSQGRQVLRADYHAPFLAHACMEPINCTVALADGKAEVWVSTQDGLATAVRVAKAADIAVDDVKVHPLYLGGGFGRRGPSSFGFIDEAVEIARQAGAPVKTIWSREDDIRQDHYRPAISSGFQAALDEKGQPIAWRNRYIGKNEPAEAAHIPYAIPHQSIGYVEHEHHVPLGPWRSVAHSQHTFFTESFIDELAHAAGADPLEYRRALLRAAPRHLAVLELAASKGGWGTALAEGRGRGIAIQESFQTIVAQVVEVSVAKTGELQVHRVVAAVDCGLVVNPDTAAQQVESGILYGLSAALLGEITIEGGAVVQSNFHDYEVLRLAQAPRVDTYFVNSALAPGGLGEPATPPIAAALANAVFAATGKRVRSLPFKNHRLQS